MTTQGSKPDTSGTVPERQTLSPRGRNLRLLMLSGLFAVMGSACSDGAADIAEFDYEASAPTDYQEVGLYEAGPDDDVRSVTFDSPLGSEVTGLIGYPREGMSDRAVLLLHGVPDSSQGMVEPLVDWACAGALTLAIDMPFARPDISRMHDPLPMDETERLETVQLLVDLRRSIDVLEELGAERIALVAISGGAVIGGTFVGIEDRLDGSVLIVGNGGPAHRYLEFGEASLNLIGRSEEEIDAYVDLMFPYSPIHFVGDANAPILFVNGRDDVFVSADSAKLVQEAAGASATVSWYNSGHDLPIEAFVEVHDWVGAILGSIQSESRHAGRLQTDEIMRIGRGYLIGSQHRLDPRGGPVQDRSGRVRPADRAASLTTRRLVCRRESPGPRWRSLNSMALSTLAKVHRPLLAHWWVCMALPQDEELARTGERDRPTWIHRTVGLSAWVACRSWNL